MRLTDRETGEVIMIRLEMYVSIYMDIISHDPL